MEVQKNFGNRSRNLIEMSKIMDLLEFNIYSDHAEVKRCTNKSVKEVVIPNKVNGLPVTSIGEEAFCECSNLISVTIKNADCKIIEL